MLFEHQRIGALWLAARRRGYLGDVPGTGKTRTAIAALDEDENVLVVCPAIVRTHWRRELEEMNVDNAIVKSYNEIVLGGVPLMKKMILDEKIQGLVMDEAHSVRHAGAQRTQVLLGPDGYARRLSHVYALSGTPIPKNPGELWTILSAMFPEVCVEHGLKTRAEFLARFCVTRGSYVRGEWREKVLPVLREEAEYKAILEKIMLRRTLDDIGLDVPQIFWQTTRLDGPGFTLDERDKGAALEVKLYLGELADIENEPHIARMRRRLGELKVKPVGEMLCDELPNTNEKIVVFAHHRDVLEGLRGYLAQFGVSYVDGSTTEAQRSAAIDRFQNDPAVRVFLGQNIACKEGITLTAARRVILVEPDWSAYVNVQLGKRVARIGQRAERCVGQMIALAGTLDEAIVGQNLQETKLADAIGHGET